jgi:outer membrane protein OmpA-like peptidoglycan-associated protein
MRKALRLQISRSVGLALSTLGALLAAGEAGNTSLPASSSPTGAWQYVGDSTRLGLGYDSQFKVTGDLLQTLQEGRANAVLGEGWVGSRSAGGLQLDFHFLNDPMNPLTVYKFFVAADQNAQHDRKLTLGGGFEKESYFAGLTLSRGLMGRRLVDSSTETITTSQWNNPVVTTTTTDQQIYEKAYDFGTGIRVGRMLDSSLLRITGGLDYEWGKHETKASQTSASLRIEKFFLNTPHSLMLQIGAFHKDGLYEIKKSWQSAMVAYRYSFGKPYRAKFVAASAPVKLEPVAPPKPTIQKKLVKHTISVATDAFFELDKYELLDTAKVELDRIGEKIQKSGVSGVIHVMGHTCDLGTHEHNVVLSQNRAEAVRSYLISKGVAVSDKIVAEWFAETQPKFPNTDAERHKNRRVDLEFLTWENATEEVVIPPAPVEPVKTVEAAPTPQEPAWVRRALRTPLTHKREVDVYRIVDRKVTTTTTTTPNDPPIAVDDEYTVEGNSGDNSLSVLDNDSDPDMDPLSITQVSTPSHGSIKWTPGSQVILYTPNHGFFGDDSFTYTISDGKGGTAVATVRIQVPEIIT